MQEHAHKARVKPFLAGIPCSIHGKVFEDHVLAFRPCELVVLRPRGSPRFRYAPAASFWDPPPADRAAMRQMARQVGVHLRDTEWTTSTPPTSYPTERAGGLPHRARCRTPEASRARRQRDAWFDSSA
jgi:hypothetical protein